MRVTSAARVASAILVVITSYSIHYTKLYDGSNAIEVHIHNLRKKLAVDLIKTVRGIGYTVKKA